MFMYFIHVYVYVYVLGTTVYSKHSCSNWVEKNTAYVK